MGIKIIQEMYSNQNLLNPEVSAWINNLNHPKSDLIQIIRSLIINCTPGIVENIKWNSPNYSCTGHDRITLRIQPVKNFQIILHRGASKDHSITVKPIEDDSPLLEWKSNDRAIISLNSNKELENIQPELKRIISKWLLAP